MGPRLLLLSIIVAVAFLGTTAATEHALHPPIRILGNGDFNRQNGVLSGSGTEEDPYLIASLEIDAAGHEFGIYIENTTAYFIIRDSKVFGANQGEGWERASGIQLRNVRNGRIENCAISGNREQGISVYDSSQNTIETNLITNNGKGIHLENSPENGIFNNILRENKVYGIYLMRSSGNSVLNNISEKNRLYGIRIYSSSGNAVSGNNVAGSDRGIVLENASKNTISNNRIEANDGVGIDLLRSTANTLVANRVESTLEIGINASEDSFDNLIYHNNLISNGRNAQDMGRNRWDDGRAGNFWDDYDGLDADGNGIGDAPYMIPGGSSEDRYPLMAPWAE